VVYRGLQLLPSTPDASVFESSRVHHGRSVRRSIRPWGDGKGERRHGPIAVSLKIIERQPIDL